MDSELLVMLATQLAVRLPIFIVFGVGIALAVTRWDQNPTVAGMAIGGLAIATLLNLAGTVIGFLPAMLSRAGFEVQSISALTMVYGLVSTLLGTVGWGLLVAAIFYGRPRSAAAAPASAPPRPAN